jgi:hypothetical protein
MGDPSEASDLTAWKADEAKSAFNRAWDLLDLESRTPEEQRQMVLRAAASRYLWAEAGGPDLESKLLIGDWQVAHVLSWLGAGDLALLFASAAHQRARANGWTDWRLATAEEGMARAYGVIGDRGSRDRHAQACRSLLAELDDENRQVIEAQLATVP